MSVVAHSKVRSSVALAFFNSFVTRLGNLAVGILLAHLLAPRDFGVYAIGLTILTVLSTMSELGFTADLIRHGDFEHRAPTVMSVGLLFSCVLAGTTWLASDQLATALGNVAAAPVLRALTICLVFSGVSAVPNAIMQRRFQQGRRLIADVASFAISTTLLLVMVDRGWGVMSLAWSRVIAQGVIVVALYVLSGYAPRFGMNLAVARESLRFGLPLTFANLLSWALLSIDNVVISRNLGGTALGFYVLAFNISSWPMSALGQAVRAVALPVFAEFDDSRANPATDTDAAAADAHGRRRGRTRALHSAFALTWSASLPIGVLLCALADPLVRTVYGTRWAPSIPALIALAAFGMLRPMFDILATFLVSRGRTRPVLVVQIIWAAALVPATIFGVRAFGIAGAGWAHVAVSALVVLPLYLCYLRSEHASLKDLLKQAVPAIAAAVPAGLVAWAVGRAIDTAWLALICGAAAGGGLYVALVVRWVSRLIKAARSGDRETSVDADSVTRLTQSGV